MDMTAYFKPHFLFSLPPEDTKHKNTKHLKKKQKQANYRPYQALKGR